MMFYNREQGTFGAIADDVEISAIGVICARAEMESNPYFTPDSLLPNLWRDGFHVSVLDPYPEVA